MKKAKVLRGYWGIGVRKILTEDLQMGKISVKMVKRILTDK